VANGEKYQGRFLMKSEGEKNEWTGNLQISLRQLLHIPHAFKAYL